MGPGNIEAVKIDAVNTRQLNSSLQNVRQLCDRSSYEFYERTLQDRSTEVHTGRSLSSSKAPPTNSSALKAPPAHRARFCCAELHRSHAEGASFSSVAKSRPRFFPHNFADHWRNFPAVRVFFRAGGAIYLGWNWFGCGLWAMKLDGGLGCWVFL